MCRVDQNGPAEVCCSVTSHRRFNLLGRRFFGILIVRWSRNLQNIIMSCLNVCLIQNKAGTVFAQCVFSSKSKSVQPFKEINFQNSWVPTLSKLAKRFAWCLRQAENEMPERKRSSTSEDNSPVGNLGARILLGWIVCWIILVGSDWFMLVICYSHQHTVRVSICAYT